MSVTKAVSLGGAIVTGGCSGIGAACADVLAAEGRAVAVWDLDEQRSAAIAGQLAAQHGGPGGYLSGTHLIAAAQPRISRHHQRLGQRVLVAYPFPYVDACLK